MEEIKKRIDINFSQIEHIINNSDFNIVAKEHTNLISNDLIFIKKMYPCKIMMNIEFTYMKNMDIS
jgi:hypothetical protein